MKTNNLLMVMAAGMLMAGCSRNDDNKSLTDNERVPVKFSASSVKASSGGRSLMTANGGNDWTSTDNIGIFMVGKGTTTISEGVENYQYKATPDENDADKATFAHAGTDVAYYPVDGSLVDFVAYYPWINGQIWGEYTVNVSSQTTPANIDLLYATANNSGSGYSKADGLDGTAVDFTFSHQLAKLKLTVKKGDGITDLTGLTVKINKVSATAKFNLTNGLWSGLGSQTSITPNCTATPSADVNGVYEAILIPSSDNSVVTVTFVLGSETYTWNLASSIATFEAGKLYSYEITINKTEVSATGTITPWTPYSDGNGNKGVAN